MATPRENAERLLLEDRVACPCTERELRKMKLRDGRTAYVYQCLRCLKTSAHVRREMATGAEPMIESVDWDFYSAEAHARARAKWAATHAEWLDEHNEYLRSPEWRAKRQQVLERDKYVCQGCFSGRATQAHHLTYAHWRNELLFELVALCDECHQRAHASEVA